MPQDTILEAADTLFGRRGYDGTSMRDIAAAAGVNKALVFYYFGNKDKLFERVLEGYYQAHTDALRDAFAADGSPGERLHRVIDAYVDFVDANRRWPRLVQSQLAGTGTHLAPIARNLALLQGFLDDALADIVPPDGPLSSRQLFVTFSGAVINYFTYAPALADVWGLDPLTPGAVADRRAHLHWLVDVLLEKLQQPAEVVA